MQLKWFFCMGIIFSSFFSLGQSPSLHLNIDNDIESPAFDKWHYKENTIVRLVSETNSLNRHCYIIDLKKDSVIGNYIITKLPEELYVNYFYYESVTKTIYFLSFQQLIAYSLDSDSVINTFDHFPDYNMSFVNEIGNGQLLAWEFMAYHPLDGRSGFFLQRFDLKKQQFTDSAFYEPDFIALSHMVNGWVLPARGGLYLVHPFTGELTFYDSLLKPHAAGTFSFDDGGMEKRKRVLQRINKVRNEGIAQIESVRYLPDLEDRPDRDSLIRPFFFSKEAKYWMFSQVRDSVVYIEKLWQVDSSRLAISINRPGYGLEFRDFYIYQLPDLKLVAKKEKWRCGRADTAKNITDYFVVDLINSRGYDCFIHKGRLYFNSEYPASLFEPGPKLKIDKTYYHYTRNHNEWYLYSYELNDLMRL